MSDDVPERARENVPTRQRGGTPWNWALIAGGIALLVLGRAAGGGVGAAVRLVGTVVLIVAILRAFAFAGGSKMGKDILVVTAVCVVAAAVTLVLAGSAGRTPALVAALGLCGAAGVWFAVRQTRRLRESPPSEDGDGSDGETERP